MSKTRYRDNMPPGLKTQIVFAVILTLGAILVLPTALSARQTHIKPAAPIKSSGSVVTTVRTFSSAEFTAAAFSDWD